MSHRLRFLPLTLILAGLTLTLLLQPEEGAAASEPPAAAKVATAAQERPAPQARRRARAALRIARRARKVARRALAQAGGANARLDGLAVASDAVAGSASTGSTADYVALGGPSVDVTVPASGLIEIWATVRFDDPSDGQVALYEDGERVPVPGQDGLCSNGSGLDDVLLSAAGGAGIAATLSTPPAVILGLGCGTAGGAPGPILLERPPGAHTYELRYADCGCDAAEASFSQRTLRVAPRP